MKEIRLSFDPDFSGEIMPSVTRRVKQRQCRYLPEVLVKDYEVRAYKNGETVWTYNEKDNIQRHRIIALPEGIELDSVEITVHSTYGYDAARIFEVRMY
jgi:hypothetical protein